MEIKSSRFLRIVWGRGWVIWVSLSEPHIWWCQLWFCVYVRICMLLYSKRLPEDDPARACCIHTCTLKTANILNTALKYLDGQRAPRLTARYSKEMLSMTRGIQGKIRQTILERWIQHDQVVCRSACQCDHKGQQSHKQEVKERLDWTVKVPMIQPMPMPNHCLLRWPDTHSQVPWKSLNCYSGRYRHSQCRHANLLPKSLQDQD